MTLTLLDVVAVSFGGVGAGMITMTVVVVIPRWIQDRIAAKRRRKEWEKEHGKKRYQ